MTKKAKLEWWFYNTFGFWPFAYFDIAKIKDIIKVQKTDTALEKFIKTNNPLAYIKYVSSKKKLKVGDMVMKVKHNHAGVAFMVYKITKDCFEICSCACENPFDESKCRELGLRQCIMKSEAIDSLIRADEFLKPIPKNLLTIKNLRNTIKEHYVKNN